MKIIKIYLDWLYKKILLTEKERSSQIKEGEVYWCHLGENVGDEENGNITPASLEAGSRDKPICNTSITKLN